MTTYKEIRGTNIEAVSSDPSNPVEGQVWYNTTSNVLKGSVLTTAGAWATGGNLNTARSYSGGCGATKDAALCMGAGPPPAPTAQAITESYNGTSWTEVNDMNTGKNFNRAAGTYTSAITAGGDQFSGVAESWNGTNWTTITNEPSGSNAYGSAGADNTNALFFGGVPAQTTTRYWNGSSWTNLNAMNGNKKDLDGAGKTYTAALAIGGSSGTPSPIDLTESFNGTNWTEVNDLNTSRRFAAADGTQTSALIFGGVTPSTTNKTEEWNGTNWTETTALPASLTGLTGAGANNTNALSFGGSNPSSPTYSSTYEWTGAGAPDTRTFTDS